MKVNGIDCIYIVVISVALKREIFGLLSFIDMLNGHSALN